MRPIDNLDTWELCLLSFGGALLAGVSIPFLMAGLSSILLGVMGWASLVWLVADLIEDWSDL